MCSFSACFSKSNEIGWTEEIIAKVQKKRNAKGPKQKLIVIDPGHGGDDQGAHSEGPHPYEEKVLTLATAVILKQYLQDLGYAVLMTRKEDRGVSLEKRAKYANDHGADLFISVHYNAAQNKQAEGVEVFFYRSEEKPKRSKSSEMLAKLVLNSVIDKTKAKPRIAKHGNFAVVRETTMPAILIEGGFLTNDEERKKIMDKNYMKKIANGIASGVEHYFATINVSALN